MPIVRIDLVQGRRPDQLEALIAGVTDAVVGALDAPPASVRVLLNEVPATHWGVGGVPKHQPSEQGSGS